VGYRKIIRRDYVNPGDSGSYVAKIFRMVCPAALARAWIRSMSAGVSGRPSPPGLAGKACLELTGPARSELTGKACLELVNLVAGDG